MVPSRFTARLGRRRRWQQRLERQAAAQVETLEVRRVLTDETDPGGSTGGSPGTGWYNPPPTDPPPAPAVNTAHAADDSFTIHYYSGIGWDVPLYSARADGVPTHFVLDVLGNDAYDHSRGMMFFAIPTANTHSEISVYSPDGIGAMSGRKILLSMSAAATAFSPILFNTA